MLTEKVLLVDDEPRLLAALKRTLSLHFTVVTAQSGQEALELIAGDPKIAVVISDMQMPSMSGVELFKKIKVTAPTIRRIMLTGNADQQTAIAAVNEGAVMRFLRKPCGRDDFKKAIIDALEDYRFITSQFEMGPTDNANQEKIAKESFLSMLNHEIRTPLNHIIGLAQIIETPEPSSQRYLEILQGSADDLLTTFSRIAEYSHLSSRQEGGSKSLFSIADIIEREIDLLRPMADERDITIAVDISGKISQVYLNQDELSLAFREVLTNAIKYNTPTGHVGVIIRLTGETLAIRVTDTGIGIPEESLAKVLAAFRQSDETVSRRHDGLGLGLTLASLITSVNGGKLEVKKRDGQGTVVVMTFAHQNSMSEAEFVA